MAESARRYGLLVDGPGAGGRVPTVSSLPWPVLVCRQLGDGPWLHYRHGAAGRYRFVAPCDEVPGHAPRLEGCDAG